jgi:circadian clock protein KaiC
MGTLRWERESAEPVASEVAAAVAGQLKHVDLDAEDAVSPVRVQSFETELAARKVENGLLTRTTERRVQALSHGRTRMRECGGADATIPPRRRAP